MSEAKHRPLWPARNYASLTEIPYCASLLSYNEFRLQYLDPNIPVLIGSALTAPWRARQEWVAPNGKPAFESMRSSLCSHPVEVPVADCHCKDFTDQKRSTMDLKAFLDQWEELSDRQEPARLYLKDFHFVKAFPDYHAYQTPDIFRDDWMNEYWTRRGDMEDDYRFVYCGGDGTFTPFHADVYRSYSWSANICGVKRWTLFPPDQEHLFTDSLGNTVYDIENVDTKKFPHFHKAVRFTILQRPGETLFVPSGWWHQVHNIGDTISINHNWANGSNLDLLLDSLQSDLSEVERSIDNLQEMLDPEEWVDTCQNLLLINSGWDWSTIWNMCMCIRSRVLKTMKEQEILDSDAATTTTAAAASVAATSTIHIQPEKDGRDHHHHRLPLFDPPTIDQQPDLNLTLRRIDHVLGYIKGNEAAKSFLKRKKDIDADQIQLLM
ncbi:JmjC domain-containing protein 4 [Actinomortierella ambigua]|nr:JmjC domain-containing protein 4 [Actinomortierella ambigua]